MRVSAGGCVVGNEQVVHGCTDVKQGRRCMQSHTRRHRQGPTPQCASSHDVTCGRLEHVRANHNSRSRTKQVLKMVGERADEALIQLQRRLAPEHRHIITCEAQALAVADACTVRVEDIVITLPDGVHPAREGDVTRIPYVRARRVERHDCLKTQASLCDSREEGVVCREVVDPRRIAFYDAPPDVDHDALQAQGRRDGAWVAGRASVGGAPGGKRLRVVLEPERAAGLTALF
jgi:hypothetical protein